MPVRDEKVVEFVDAVKRAMEKLFFADDSISRISLNLERVLKDGTYSDRNAIFAETCSLLGIPHSRKNIELFLKTPKNEASNGK